MARQQEELSRKDKEYKELEEFARLEEETGVAEERRHSRTLFSQEDLVSIHRICVAFSTLCFGGEGVKSTQQKCYAFYSK